MSEDPEVLVIGAGPVGLFAALCLTTRGVRVQVIDQYRRTALHSYALALHPHTLRLLNEFGLADPLIERGQRLERIAVCDRSGRLATIKFAPVGRPFPFVLAVPQTVLEAALERKLADAGVDVHWGHQALTFEDQGETVQVLVAAVPGEPDTAGPDDVATTRTHARYVLGADGHGSLVRRLLGVERDEVGAPVTYGLLEFEARVDPCDELALVLTDGATDVLWPLGPERGRWSVQLPDVPADFDAARLLALIGERAPWFARDGCRVDWVTAVTFQPWLARSFGRGRVWLVGDAARQTLPCGVQGMNVGLREANDLARRLTAILRGEGPPELLRFYHEEREREWKMLLGLHDRLQPLPEAPGWALGLGRNLVSSLPSTGHDLNLLLEQVGLRLRWLRGADGRRS